VIKEQQNITGVCGDTDPYQQGQPCEGQRAVTETKSLTPLVHDGFVISYN
ncbi:unnamed protein product, partial [Allacma fusca]